MKRSVYVIILSVAILSLVLSACAVPKEPSSQTEPSPAGTSVKAETFLEDTATQTEPETEASVEAEILCSNEKYTISLTGEKCYINFANGNDASPNEGYSQVGSIDFPSLTEMKNHFLNNQLTAEQMLVIRCAFADETNGIRLCNLNALFNPTIPDNVLTDTVTLKGETYYFTLSSEIVTGALTVATESVYQFHYDRDFKDIDEYQITRQEDSVLNGSPCKIIEYTVPGNGDQYRDVYFTISDGEKTLDIEISYCLKNSKLTAGRPVSENIPWRVLIFGQDNGQYFYAYLRDFTIAPTVEWLTSFGVTPYFDNSDHVAS